MARSRGTAVLLLLAALAIVGGTAATVLSRRSGAGSPVPIAGDAPMVRVQRPTLRGPEPETRQASVTVRVLRADDRKPVPGAKVTLRSGPGQSSRETGADGEAVFRQAASGESQVVVDAPDLEPYLGGLLLQPGANPVHEVLLAESGLVTGRVVAAADGRPIAGARVTRVPVSASAGAGAAVTDGDGAFRLRAGIPGQFAGIEASAEGFSATVVRARVPEPGAEPQPVEIRLDRAGRIRGTVRDSRGAPVPGAHVSAVPPAPSRYASGPGGGLDTVWGTCVSGADGSYSLDDVAVDGVYVVQAYVPPPEGRGGAHRLPDGSIAIVVRIAGEGVSLPVEVFLPPDTGEAVADLVIPGWGLLAVTWRDDQGRSDGAARVLAFPAGAPSEPAESVESVPGRAGFALHLREGRWRIVVDSEHHGRGEAEAVVVADADCRVEVVVGTEPSFRGVVVDGEGRPVPWVVVEARGEAVGQPLPAPGHRWIPVRRTAGPGTALVEVIVSNRWYPVTDFTPRGCLPGARLRARTDAAGRFLMDGLAPGSRWDLFVRGDVLSVPPTGPFEVPSREIRLVARRAGAVEGRVVLPPGAPVPETRSLHFAGASPEPPGTPSLRSTARFADGRFRIEGLPPGRGVVWAAAGDLYSVPVEVDVPEGGTADAGEVPLEAGLRLSGVVKGPDGSPCAGATVQMVVEGAVRVASTLADGTFAVEGLLPGAATIAVTDSRGSPAVVTSAPVPSPSGPIEIRITRGGVLRGTARDDQGIPLAGWWVATRPASAPADPWTPRVPVGHRGAFEVAIESGEWSVAVLAPGSRDPAGETTASVPEGGEASVDLRVSSDVRTGGGPR